MPKYIENEIGAVHSVDDDHFENVLHTTVRGKRYLRPGVRRITEAEARAKNPQLFGAPDPKLKMTSAELKELRERRAFERELEEEQAAQLAEYDAARAAANDDEESGEPDDSKSDGGIPAERPKRR